MENFFPMIIFTKMGNVSLLIGISFVFIIFMNLISLIVNAMFTLSREFGFPYDYEIYSNYILVSGIVSFGVRVLNYIFMAIFIHYLNSITNKTEHSTRKKIYSDILYGFLINISGFVIVQILLITGTFSRYMDILHELTGSYAYASPIYSLTFSSFSAAFNIPYIILSYRGWK